MNILRLLLLMPTLASVAYSQTSNVTETTLEEFVSEGGGAVADAIDLAVGEADIADAGTAETADIADAGTADAIDLAVGEADAGLEEAADIADAGTAETQEDAIDLAVGEADAGLEEAAAETADIASGLPNCTQYKIDFNTDNCICNSGSTCSDKKSYYETNCINNC